MSLRKGNRIHSYEWMGFLEEDQLGKEKGEEEESKYGKRQRKDI